MIRVHGTAVALGGDGVLLRGPSGSGKSDLALRLIAEGDLFYPVTLHPLENFCLQAKQPHVSYFRHPRAQLAAFFVSLFALKEAYGRGPVPHQHPHGE